MSSKLPDPATMASLVSTVTQTMCGVSFEPADDTNRPAELCSRMASLPISGARPVRVVLASNPGGAAALSSALFGMTTSDLDDAMVNDALCELLNMAAGQIRTALGLDQALGLPKIVDGSDRPRLQEMLRNDGVLLRSRGAIDLLIWVSEGSP